MKTLSSSLNTILCYCLPYSDDVSCDVNIAGMHLRKLFVPASKNDISSFTVHTFTPDFVYSFQINWKMLDISYKINGSFSLTRLLTMFYRGATFYWDTV